MTHFNLLGAAPRGRDIAAWHNALQELAASTRLGIPVTVSTDPRHSFSDNPGAAMMAGPFSQWPETIGLAAIGDEELVERFADIARQEYTAVGLRVALHPQVDLATEPRWARQVATFGEDAELSGRLGAAYIRGFQGASFGPGSVSTMTKHFPGGGPQKDGEDPHFAYGREQVYPGGQFELHLKPFEAAFEAGTRQIMPYYGMPVGTEYEEVGFGFNKSVITGLLRERFGFDGHRLHRLGPHQRRGDLRPAVPGARLGRRAPDPARAHGQGPRGRCRPVRRRSLPRAAARPRRAPARSARSASTSRRARILREKFELGLFDDPFVDEDAADAIVGRADFRAAGEAAQRASITVLTNRRCDRLGRQRRRAALPLARGLRLYVEGIDPEVAAALRHRRRVADRGGCRDPAPAGAVRAARHDVRELLPRGLARLLRTRSSTTSREIAAAVPTDRRRPRRPPGDPRADRRRGRRRSR